MPFRERMGGMSRLPVGLLTMVFSVLLIAAGCGGSGGADEPPVGITPLS